jgi:Rieske Fe-S protein
MNAPAHDNRSAAPSADNRRGFLQLASLALGAVASALAAVPLVGYVFARRQERALWVDLGPVDSFPQGETRLVAFDNPLRQPWDGITSQAGVFVRYQGAGPDAQPDFLVLSVHCAHLGCPVTWFPQSQLFLCPCHGGVYYADGAHASGPPPRGLFHCVWRVRGGQLELRAPHYPTLHDTLAQPT